MKPDNLNIAGGYNLKALTRYTDMAELAAHLLAGSIGTLGIVTEIRLKLLEQRPLKGTFVAHFRDYGELGEAALRLKALDPAALEFSDASCAGRARSYLALELGPAYGYLREIKKLFDPDDMFNPGALFDTAPISTNMDFSIR